MKRAFSVTLTLLFANVIASAAAEPKLPKNIVRSFDKSSPGTELKAKAPDYIYGEVVRVSPDGKYVARLVRQEGEYGGLTVYRRVGKKNIFSKRYAVSRFFDDVGGCIWVPHHQHRLVVTNGGDGRGGIALWNGPNKTRFLKRNSFDVGDGYNAYGTSLDGRVLYYEHFGPGTRDPDGNRYLVLTLRLPA